VRVSPTNHDEAIRLSRVFEGAYSFDTRIDVLGAIGQPIKTGAMFWDRDRGIVVKLQENEREAILGRPTFRDTSL